MTKRLQVILAETGIVSRRGAERWIAEGRVSVDGQVVQTAGQSYKPGAHKIAVDGRPIPHKPPLTWRVLNKPAGVTCTLSDRYAERTLRDIWGEEGDKLGLRPVGRLDRESRGLLLLTNDGRLIHRLTHPRWQVQRVYQAKVLGEVGREQLGIMSAGIEIEGKPARPEKVEIIRRERETTLLRIILREGRKREVRLLCRAAGHHVVDLLRISFGSLQLKNMEPGEIRDLTPIALKRLYHEVGLIAPQSSQKQGGR
jgi:23S rRNA pseudouridine2605 synthase